MKKFSQFLATFVLMFFVFGAGTAKADDGLLSAFVKSQANTYCSSATFKTIQDEVDQDEVDQDEMILNEVFELDTNTTKSSGGFVNQTATSKLGSKIIMPATITPAYGYCHIFYQHMDRSDGTLNKKIGNKTQFQYAFFPDKTMDIALEVINLQSNLVPGGDGRYTKEIYLSSVGQVVRVSLNTTSNFAGGIYSPKYDYVIVSVYPVF